MNASDIIKARQNRVLYQAYYRPTIFQGSTANGSNVFITSTINFCPVSSISSSGTVTSSVVSCVTVQYQYKCEPTNISYQMLNDINNGKYECGYPYCSSISQWNTGRTFPAGNCNCNVSFLTWKNTTSRLFETFSTSNTATGAVERFTTLIPSGPAPVICPFVEFNQGTNFASRCDTCNTALFGNNACCGNCASGQ